jgi:hypothetical protein
VDWAERRAAPDERRLRRPRRPHNRPISAAARRGGNISQRCRERLLLSHRYMQVPTPIRRCKRLYTVLSSRAAPHPKEPSPQILGVDCKIYNSLEPTYQHWCPLRRCGATWPAGVSNSGSREQSSSPKGRCRRDAAPSGQVLRSETSCREDHVIWRGRRSRAYTEPVAGGASYEAQSQNLLGAKVDAQTIRDSLGHG